MKTTKFFSEIKKVAKDSTIESMFAYSVNPDKNFYEIILHSEPTKKIEAMCKKNGFSIEKNILNKNENGEMVQHTIWEVRPINAEDIEFASDEVLFSVNNEVVIASDKAMMDAGLIRSYCTPRKGIIGLWAYMYNNIWKEYQWTPIFSVFESPVLEDIKDEDGFIVERKSTHKISGFYACLMDGKLDFRRFLENRNVQFEEI